MPVDPDTAPIVSTPRDAATVVLLRPRPNAFDVFMVKRSGLSDVLGDAHVFPGGKADKSDASIEAAALRELREEAGVALEASALVPWTRWITPTAIPKRFDARFFLAVLPEGQTAMHDGHEATSSEWLAPADALARADAGEIILAPPTYVSLSHLATLATIDDVFADAHRRGVPVMQPIAFDDEGVRCLALPGDPRHAESAPRVPGPVRFWWKGKAFVAER